MITGKSVQIIYMTASNIRTLTFENHKVNKKLKNRYWQNSKYMIG